MCNPHLLLLTSCIPRKSAGLIDNADSEEEPSDWDSDDEDTGAYVHA
jgi:hypothetical protein